MKTENEVTHRFARITTNDDGSKGIGRGVRLDAPMFEGQKEAVSLAKLFGCDVAHEVYNDKLNRWEYLGTYHTDGTFTDSFGGHYRFTDDPVRPWAKIEEGGEQ